MPRDAQVLIIGGGVVGLSAALFLAQHGIKSITIERRLGTSIHPRSRSINLRTAELFRHLGIDDLVHEAGKGIASSKGIYTGTTLKEVIDPHPRKEGHGGFPFDSIVAQFSPAKGTFVTQDKLEPVLADTIKSRNIDLRFGFEFVSLTQDNTSVTTTIKNRETGDTSTLTTDYIIAADGAKSPVCRHLGVKKFGQGTLGYMINILFKADLADYVKNREFSLVKIRSSKVNGLFTSINNADRWVFHLSYDPSKGEQASDYTKESCKKLVKLALGMPDVDITIESLLSWEPAVNVAESMKHGRVFLAGDAAHQMPPWAGQGANSGFSDAHNLSWKLAAVLNGTAGEALLDTYSSERQPVGKYAAEASAMGVDEYGCGDMNIWRSEVRQGLLMKMPLFSGLGYEYHSQAICEENNWPLGGLTWKPWTFSSVFLSLDGRPGRRVPHTWVQHNGDRVSTLDLVKDHLMLLVDQDSAAEWKAAAASVSKQIGMQINVYSVGPNGDLVTNDRDWNKTAGVASKGALLVRPDDFVAKRWRRSPSIATEELSKAMQQVLGRHG